MQLEQPEDHTESQQAAKETQPKSSPRRESETRHCSHQSAHMSRRRLFGGTVQFSKEKVFDGRSHRRITSRGKRLAPVTQRNNGFSHRTVATRTANLAEELAHDVSGTADVARITDR